MFRDFFQKIWQEAYSENTKNITKLIVKNPKAAILDVGCGDGQHTMIFSKAANSKNLTGLDGNKDRLRAAKKRGVKKTVVANLEKKWPIKDSSFDVVIANQVIEHIYDIDHFILEIKRVLKPSGYAIISTENLASWHNIFALILGFQDFSHHLVKRLHVGNPLSPHMGEKTASWSAKDNSGSDDSQFPHVKIFTFRSLIRVFKEFGFKFQNGKASGYYPFFGIVGKILSILDPFHSHFITIKVKKLNDGLDEIWNQVPKNYYEKGVGENLLQKYWHTEKVNTFKKLTQDINPKNILDVGCASGRMANEISKYLSKSKISGVDVYSKALEFGKKKYPHIKFLKADAHRLPFRNNSFDLVICYEVIEHVVDPAKTLSEIKRVMKKNGRAIVAMDSGNILFRIVWFFWENTKGKVWKGAHLHPFRHKELTQEIISSGLKIEKKVFSHFGMEVSFLVKKS